jgi:hypothetical protein
MSGGAVSLVRRFWSGVIAKETLFAVYTDIRLPLAVSLAERHAFIAACVVCPLSRVGVILSSRRMAQIAEPVIRTVTVYVINVIAGRGPKTANMQPHKVVRCVLAAIDGNADMTITVGRSSNRTGPDTFPSLSLPENSSLRIVIQQLSKPLRRQLLLRHFQLLSNQWFAMLTAPAMQVRRCQALSMRR